jgi:hypothetical protein
VDIIDPPPRILDPDVGDTQSFHVTNSIGGYTFDVPADLWVIGDHIYLWVEEGVAVSRSDLEDLADAWDDFVYDGTRQLWGSEATPGIDGDLRVHALFAYDMGIDTAAYFARRHTYPQEVFPGSNEREMFFMNLDSFGNLVSGPIVESVMSHEFQHMIRANVDGNEDSWLDEGFSTFTELYLGYHGSDWFGDIFLLTPGTQLNTFGETGDDRAPNYGAGFLFVTYFYERYGLDASNP